MPASTSGHLAPGGAAAAYDVVALRTHFPSLASGIAHFDGPGGTQTPLPVGQAILDTLTGPLSNEGVRTLPERNATAAIEAFRSAYADFLGADPRGIVFGRSATQLTYDFSRHLAKTWQPGDEIVVSRLDHDSNVSPWLQAAAARGVVVRWIDFDPSTGELDEASVAAAIGARTRLVAITAASNLLGTMPDLPTLAGRAHAVGALVYADAVHFAAHGLVDLAAWGADFVVCSPYKFLGPHCGVLAGSAELLESLRPDKLAPSSDEVPARFEFGTLPYELLAGAAAAVDFLAALGGEAGSRRERLASAFARIHTHESALATRLEAGLAALGGDRVVLHSRAARRTPTLLFSLPGRSGAEAAQHLADRGVHCPSGTFYAYQAGLRLGIADPLRAGLAPYSTDDDVDRLLAGLADFLN